MAVIVRWLGAAAVIAVATGSAAAAEPAPLHGAPLTGKTGLRLLVASVPPLLVDVDSGHVARITGLPLQGRPVLSVSAVGKDAVVWLDRPSRGVPRAEIYVVRHDATKATRLAAA